MEEIIKKFWQKETKEQERKELLQQLSKENPELYESLKTEFYNSEKGNSIKEEKFEKVLQALHAKIKISQTRQTRLFPIQFYKAAAVIAFLFLAAGMFYLNSTKQIIPEELNENNFTRIENPHDQKIMYLELNDGSKVKLYPNSSIDYSDEYGTANRNISLNGKAYFKVAKNKEIPFVVESDNYTTTALGTEFLVDSQTENLKIKLYEGSIVIKSTLQSKFKFESVYLKPGEEFKINTKSGMFKHSLNNQNDFKSESKTIEFTQNETEESDKIQVLKYRKADLKLVLDELAEHYGKTIKYQSSEIDGLTFTGEISITDPLENSLSRLCYLNELKLTEKDDEIIIHK